MSGKLHKEIIIAILCGGGGTRLFPKSNDKSPKQFLRLENEYSLLQNTILRLSKYKQMVLVSNEKHVDLLKTQLVEINQLLTEKITFTIILEPYARNTCPAISIVAQMFPHNNVIVMPSDHIYDEATIVATIKLAEDKLIATSDKIVVLGIQPTRPETGYGYLLCENNTVSKFIEKPSLDKAIEYLQAGNYYWNSGIVGFNSQTMNSLIKLYEPVTFNKCHEILSMNNELLICNEHVKISLLDNIYKDTRSISIDFAIMEKLNQSQMNLIVYKGRWNDIGSWLSVHEIKEHDQNSINKDAIFKNYNSSRCLIIANKKVYLNGVSNLAIIETDDAIMISHIDKSQDVKKLLT